MIPGITTDYGATNLSCNDTQFTGVESFVGGASDGNIGAAVMRYTNPYTGSLSFQKAWFFLDDGVQHIMIPHAVSNASYPEHPLISVLDQKRLNGTIYVDGAPVSKSTNFTKATSLWHDGVGYAFDLSSTSAYSSSQDILGIPRTQSSLAVSFGPRSGDWATIGISTVGNITVDLFSAWVDHGPGYAPALPFAYTAFPGTPSVHAFKQKAKSARAQLQQLRNDADICALFDSASGTLFAVFWAAQGGEVAFAPGGGGAPVALRASAGAVVIYKLDEGELTVADPTQTLASVELAVTVGTSGRPPKGCSAGQTEVLDVTLPFGGVIGSSITVQL